MNNIAIAGLVQLWPAISPQQAVSSLPKNCFDVFALFCFTPTAVDGVGSVWSNECVEPKGRILAVDYGGKNIGLACCDELGLTVQPMPSLPNLGTAGFIKKLRSIADSLGVQEIVLGIPFKMDGTRGDAALRMEKLLEVLRAALEVPVVEADERLSTVEALEVWRGMNKKQQKKYRTVDSLAAAFILERRLKEM